MPLNRSSNLIVRVEVELFGVGVPAHGVKTSLNHFCNQSLGIVFATRTVQNVQAVKLGYLEGLGVCESGLHLMVGIQAMMGRIVQ